MPERERTRMNVNIGHIAVVDDDDDEILQMELRNGKLPSAQ